MHRLLFPSIFTLLAFTSKGQVASNYIDNITDSLRRVSVDTFLIYSVWCHGDLLCDTCAAKPPQYLFWKQHDNYYLKRYDYRRSYKPIQLDTANPLKYYLQNELKIANEEIKEPIYVQSKTRTTVTTFSASREHTCYHDVKFQMKSKVTSKKVDYYHLDFKRFDNGKQNLNYTYNHQTKLKALIKKTAVLIKQLTEEGKFETL